ncbi:hypothetical protein [Burkholderia sp. Ac-20379]|uniref:hypothetical protein n=1 Tax=Burkholderia sp. Ac-20379 TaxID=2703900 RepID=UPI0019803218|nr:hypothetical protein [Burkholderia sp. Ac-20379]MBN3723826.1 hypothetical protein [Burkholderia sp. Ac-20379]
MAVKPGKAAGFMNGIRLPGTRHAGQDARRPDCKGSAIKKSLSPRIAEIAISIRPMLLWRVRGGP